MKKNAFRSAVLTVLFVVGFLAVLAVAADKQPPKEIVFEAKPGKVVFNHAAHVEKAGGKCDSCHPKLFPKSKEPLNYKKGIHKPAEAAKTSCAGCHVAGGTAFESKGNCKKCHGA